jgi:hypothetical protein
VNWREKQQWQRLINSSVEAAKTAMDLVSVSVWPSIREHP